MPEKKTPNMEPQWMEAIGEEFEQPYMKTLRAFLLEEKKQHTICPPSEDMFNAFWYTPFNQVRVVMLGQDPYHGEGQAHGLCFSVKRGIDPPPSLRNMFRELHEDLGICPPSHGYLETWARQGVFLLNTCLSVRAHQAQSHANKGWETFTDKVIKVLNSQRENLVFVLWGNSARNKEAMIDSERHQILTAPHPSPLSAHRGFFGCRHFSRINRHLVQLGQEPIDWQLPE